MDGILVVDKPIGPTSHDVVSAVRRAIRQKKVGHTGTLDPNATGVLPLVIGQATKIARFFSGGDKGYDAVVRLGVTTTTLDAVGDVVEEKPVTVTEEQVREAVESFQGEIEQLPPMYSAKKVDGKRLYELARKGVEVEREPKKVRIDKIEVLSYEAPDIHLVVHCSSGTYVRVIAEDIGAKLGCGGHLLSLRRTFVGPFDLEQCVALDALEDDPSLAGAQLVNMADALSHLPTVSLPKDLAKMVSSGYQLTVGDLHALDLPEFSKGELVTLLHDDGHLLAVANAEVGEGDLGAFRRDQRAIKTERVFPR
ncbi:MAG: tRNA pseudouridine(55) synthase TruB [Myxococcota bacterium]